MVISCPHIESTEMNAIVEYLKHSSFPAVCNKNHSMMTEKESMRKRFSILPALLAIPAIFSAHFSFGLQISEVAGIPRDSAAPVPLKGEMLLFPLTNGYIAVAGLYDDFFTKRILENYHSRLAGAEQLPRNKDWSRQFFYNFAAADIMSRYLPSIRDNFQNPAYFRIKVNGRETLPAAHGYWINAVGIKRLPRVNGRGIVLTESAELVPFAYIRLDQPLKNNDLLEISATTGEKASLRYDDKKTNSRAIKVNQVGYAPAAKRKYAYLGMWLAELGPLPVKHLEGKEFHLRDTKDGSIAFTGKITYRMPDQHIMRDREKIALYGEEIMELDFSDFSKTGNYYIHVPDVGRSWDFAVSDDAIGRAFYVQMRGLFHQRSGIAKTPSHTQWSMGADHKISYRGGFPPNDRHYRGKNSRIIRSDGTKADLSHFHVVKATATDEALPDVCGGWWDAGDFDRRTYHFQVVDSLLSIYLLFPENFKDAQLDLPESGNGIPDIIDEAAWGVEVWRRAQNEKGGVGCWLEATSHPKIYDPVKDTQRYYLALPTRESTLQYCAHAAKLARAYDRCGRKEPAQLFFKSAEKAWNFAMNPANRADTKFRIMNWGVYHYTEPGELPQGDLFKAALNLYLYTKAISPNPQEPFSGDPKYLDILDKLDFGKILADVKDTKSPYFLSELAEDERVLFTQASKYRRMIREKADELLKNQETLAYRNLNWSLKSPYFTYLAWGAGLPFSKGAYLIMAWRIDGMEKYRDGAFLAFDWMMGANPMGRSMTTGLGKVYPVRILSLPMWAWNDRLVDPIPGITPYTFTGRNNYSAASMIYRYACKPRPDHKFKGCDINLLPASLRTKEKMNTAEYYRIIQKAIPLWREFANLEGYAVDQNEFTVWETIAPAAAAYGALLTPGWMPPKEWKNQKPEKDIRKLPGYIFLP